MDGVLSWINGVLGIGVETKALTVFQVSARAALIFAAGVALVRVGKKRFLGKNTALDALLAVMVGSVLGRAINGSAPVYPTLGGMFFLIALHWVMSALAYRSRRFDDLVKGHRRVLIEGGQLQRKHMRATHINDVDLEEAVRLKANGADLSQVETAYLERSGDVSVVRKKREPEVIVVKVEPGVQEIRIRLE